MKNARFFSKIMSVVLAMAMVVSMLPMSVFATQTDVDYGETTVASTENVAKVGNTEYATLAEAIAAADDKTVTLLRDVELTSMIFLQGGVDVTVEGAGKTITFVGDLKYGFAVKESTLTLGKDLNVVATGDTAPVYVQDGTVYTSANLTAKGEYAAIQGNGGCEGDVYIKDGTITTEKCIAIYWPQNGKLTISDGTISGPAGVEIRAGSLTMTGGTITATGGELKFADTNNGSYVRGGVAVSLSQHTTKHPISINITGGTLDGTYAFYQSNATGDPSTEISASIGAEVILNGEVEAAEEGFEMPQAADGSYTLTVADYVAEINGKKFATLSAAFAAVTDDSQTVTILSDVTEELTGAYLRGNIVAEDDVTITLTNTDWVYLPYTFVVGENVTLKAPALFYYAGGSEIRGTVVTDAYYQRNAGTKLTIYEPGSMTVTSEQFYLRYTDGDSNAGIYVVGDNNDETIGLNTSVIYFYQGMINAKDANIKTAVYWQTNETDGQGSANLVLDNTKMNVTVNEHNAKATGNSTVTLTNGSNLTCAGEFVYGENAVISVDATSGIYDKNGKVEFATPVAKIGETEYFDLHEAMMAAKAGETVLLLTDVDLAGTEWEPVSFKGLFNGQGNTIHNLTINKPGVSNTGFITSLNGTFENVTFTNPTVTGGENTGVVAGRAGGGAALARNITVNGTIKVETTHSGYARTGVIVGGWAYGNYVDITVDGDDPTVSYVKHSGGGDGRYVAGIVGHADDVDSYVNCTVKNISIISENDGWLCGGIAGPGPSDGSASGCVVENVKIGADYSGGMFGWYYGNGTIENSTIKNVEFTASTTKNGAIGGYGVNNDANVTNVTIENVTNGGAALLEHVAEIDGTYYFALQEAIDAANSGDTVKLLRDVEVSNTINVETNIVLDGNNHKIVPASDFVANGHGAVIALAASASDYSADSDYTIKNLTFEGFSGLNRVVRANFGDIVIEDCQFNGNTVTGGVITSSFANLTVDGCAFDGNTVSGFGIGIIDVGSDVSNGTEVVANITNSSFTNNNAAIAGIYLASSANVTGNYFSGNTHTGDNGNGAAILAGPYTGNMAYTIVVNKNAFVNAMNGKPAVFAEDWSSLGSTTDFNLNGNYWNGGEPADGYLTSGSNPDVTLENYYATYEDGVLSNLVEISSGLSGSGTEEDPYLIKSIEDLILFRDSVNAGETEYNAPGVYVALGDDIDMAGTDWSVNIGDGANTSFDGIFDGKEYVLKNLTGIETAQVADGYICSGLFGCIGGNAVIKNLTIKDVTIDCTVMERTGVDRTEPHNVGVVVGFAWSATGSVENVAVTGDIKIDAPNVDGVGGIVGYDYYGKLTVKDCSVIGNDGSYITGAAYVGGVIGYASSNSNISGNTVENVDITAQCCVGGVAGLMLGSGKAVDNTVKTVELTATHENWKNSAAAVVGTISGGAVTVSGNTVEGVNAAALVGSEWVSKPAAPVAKVEARIGDNYYTTLAAALEANVEGEVVLLTPITIAAGETVTIDLNGKTVTGTDEATGSFGLITNRGTLTIKDSVGGGMITLTATNNRGWNAYSSVVSNNPGGKFTLESGTLEHLGGTSMAYGIDNLTNGKGTYAETVINGGTVKSTYRAIRQFLNGVEAQNILTVNGGTIEGANKSIWFQDPSTKANTGTLTVSENAVLKGDVYLTVTAGSTEWPVEVSIAAAALDGESTVLTGNVPEGYELKLADGVYGVVKVTHVAEVDGTKYESLQEAIDAADGKTVTLLTDITLTETVTVVAGQTVTIDLNGKTITGTDNATGSFGLITSNGDLTIKDSSAEQTGKITLTATKDRGWNAYSSVISNNPGGKLTVESGTIEHLGGTSMAYGIDNLTNGKDTYAETVINGGTVTSAYIGVRQFLNGVEAQNILTINGGTVTGGNSSIYFQSPSAKANTGTLTISENASIDKRIYLGITDGTTEWPVEISVAAAALAEGVEIVSDPIPEGYELKLTDGTWGVVAEEAMTGSVRLKNGALNLEDKVSIIYRVTTGAISTNEANVAERGVLLYASAEDAATKDPSRAFETVKVEYEDVDTETGYAVYKGQTEGIDARDMKKSQYAVAYLKMLDGTYIFGTDKAGDKDQVIEYSPMIYCQNMKKDPDVGALCNALMQYGAAAQMRQYSDDERGDLMNEGFDAVAFDESVLGEEVFSVNSAMTNGMKLRSVAMDLQGYIAYIVRFSTEEAIAGKQLYAEYELLGETKSVELVLDTDPYYEGQLKATITGIPAKDLGATLKVKAYYLDDNGEKVYGGELVYSAYEYVRRALLNEKYDELDKELARALAMYIHCADAYGNKK